MITGPNGAGKTTSAMALLPDLLQCQEYVNADTIAAALSPFNPTSTALKAGRLMLGRIHHLAEQKLDFAFETTGASKTFIKFLTNCKSKGYNVNILYLWLHSTELAISRVASRVSNGGHDIPAPIIHRRYYRGLNNFFKLFAPIADNWSIYDNSGENPGLIARKLQNSDIMISEGDIWKTILETIKL